MLPTHAHKNDKKKKNSVNICYMLSTLSVKQTENEMKLVHPFFFSSLYEVPILVMSVSTR